jgi:GrpB-like predicted nucleotidyltransferase (UPF0157 family)
VPYTSQWARDFEREKQRLSDAYANYPPARDRYNYNFSRGITHIGSTSIPGALAKPYIDMHFHGDYQSQARIFFQKYGYRPYGTVRRHEHEPNYLYKPCEGESSTCKGYFLHFGSGACDMILFTQRLQSDASLLQLYNETKRRIMADHPCISFPEYTVLKTAFVRSVRRSNGGRNPPNLAPLYELIHFITSTTSGHVPSMQPLPFAPNEVFHIGDADEYDIGYSQYFTPLGLALVLAIEPRLSALWSRYLPNHYDDDTLKKPPDASTSPTSESARRARLERFVPIIRRLRQHGCTKTAFASWTHWQSPIIDAINAGGAEFGGIAPDRRLELAHYNLMAVKNWYAELHGQPAAVIYSMKRSEQNDFIFGIRGGVRSAIYLSELRSFGPSAAALFHDVCIARVLDTLQLQHHLAAFIKEGVTDDIVCSLSTDNLRSLGLGLGDAVRFMTAMQKELAVVCHKTSPHRRRLSLSAMQQHYQPWHPSASPLPDATICNHCSKPRTSHTPQNPTVNPH